MKNITANELRSMYLKFFESKKHKIINSASLIPENDPSVLFTTAGMHPLVPYLLGEKHPSGTRLTDSQKCVRTGDIDEVGDASHLTFFEMLGNWSLGDYFKQESIRWSFEFLTDEKYLNIPIDELAVTVFAGDNDAPRDEESAGIWAECGIPKDRIFYLPKKNNWWIAGKTGPCGPDTEIFVIRKNPCSSDCTPACDCGRYLEIWNNVFMQYYCREDGTYEPLKQKNVDTGMGLERTLCILNGVESVYDTEIFKKGIEIIEKVSNKKYKESAEVTKAFRIILDHMRTATFLIGDVRGIVPSNVDQGYVLRRLIRRIVRIARTIDVDAKNLLDIPDSYIDLYKDHYEELNVNREKIKDVIAREMDKFSETLGEGTNELYKVMSHIQGNIFPGKTAFRLYDTFGFPLEITEEMVKEKGFTVDREGYEKAFEEHRMKSSVGSEKKFKGGLADSGVETARLHTATHLMQAALKKVLSPDISQKGSNITQERLRFDFNFDRPMTKEEIQEVEKLVNEAIEADVTVVMEQMTVDEAKKSGAIGVFGDKYGEQVKVYTIGKYSKEICGGPHANHTGELGHFKIIKEQSSSSGIRRIKAVLDNNN